MAQLNDESHEPTGRMNPSADPSTYGAHEVGVARHALADARTDAFDEVLMTRMAQQDTDALAALYDRWSPSVRGLVLRIVGESADSDEVVEEVFWQCWQQADRFDVARGRVAVWILTIARSRALDRLRARKRRGGEVPDTFRDGSSRVAQLPASRPSLDPGEFADQRERVSLALTALPDEQRETVELAYFSGLSQSEIAERLAVPLGTVKTRTRLAFGKLRESLATLWDDAR